MTKSMTKSMTKRSAVEAYRSGPLAILENSEEKKKKVKIAWMSSRRVPTDRLRAVDCVYNIVISPWYQRLPRNICPMNYQGPLNV